MSAVWIEIVETRGSTPRDAGTAMKVTEQGQTGTIGGGRLEYEAIAVARELLVRDVRDDLRRKYPLGPNLGQCCGGSVTLRFTREERPLGLPMARFRVHVPRPNPPHPKFLWLWGAGHVGRAVVDATWKLPLSITWADTDASRFPERIPDNVTVVPAADLPLLAQKAPPDAHHLIFTYSHDIDFELCAALLGRKTASIGLIGSDTKRTRFFKRLRAIGLDPSRITCPIGDKSLGKRPDQIASGVVAALSPEVAA